MVSWADSPLGLRRGAQINYQPRLWSTQQFSHQKWKVGIKPGSNWAGFASCALLRRGSSSELRPASSQAQYKVAADHQLD